MAMMEAKGWGRPSDKRTHLVDVADSVDEESGLKRPKRGETGDRIDGDHHWTVRRSHVNKQPRTSMTGRTATAAGTHA
jgi:hypothetical protein